MDISSCSSSGRLTTLYANQPWLASFSVENTRGLPLSPCISSKYGDSNRCWSYQSLNSHNHWPGSHHAQDGEYTFYAVGACVLAFLTTPFIECSRRNVSASYGGAARLRNRINTDTG
ncbi:hypothetical protein BaRGS_00027913, partial [Batillaria attramentaria]